MKRYLLAILSLALSLTSLAKGNEAKEYAKKAKYMYDKVYSLYRVPHHGLFSEHYPSEFKADLTYFEGGARQANETSYLWPYSGMCSATTIMAQLPKIGKTYKTYIDTMAIGMEMYKDTTRTPFGYQAYPAKLQLVDRYYDDNGLVGIDYVEFYMLTKNKTYLQRSKDVFRFILSGWDEVLGGGVTWLEGHRDQKPACSNGKATVLALKLYEATGDKYYLDWGKKFYGWMYSNLRDSSDFGIYWNDRKTETGIVNKTPYTYNTGTMLQAAVMLYQFTKDASYLKEAQHLAEGSFRYFGKKQPDGRVLVADLPWFVVVLFRGYEALYYVDGNDKYINAIIETADYAWSNARDKHGLIYNDWNGKNDEYSSAKWLLDESCMAELYGRIALIKSKGKVKKK